MYVCAYVRACMCVMMPEEGTSSSEAKIRGGCEPPHVGARPESGPLEEEEEFLIMSRLSSLSLLFCTSGLIFHISLKWKSHE